MAQYRSSFSFCTQAVSRPSQSFSPNDFYDLAPTPTLNMNSTFEAMCWRLHQAEVCLKRKAAFEPAQGFSTANNRNPLWLTRAEKKLTERVSSGLLVGRKVGRTATGSWQENPGSLGHREHGQLHLRTEEGEDAVLLQYLLSSPAPPQLYHRDSSLSQSLLKLHATLSKLKDLAYTIQMA